MNLDELKKKYRAPAAHCKDPLKSIHATWAKSSSVGVPKTLRIVAISSGGVKGIMSIAMLKKIHKASRGEFNPAVMMGCSVGAIISAYICSFPHKAYAHALDKLDRFMREDMDWHLIYKPWRFRDLCSWRISLLLSVFFSGVSWAIGPLVESILAAIVFRKSAIVNSKPLYDNISALIQSDGPHEKLLIVAVSNLSEPAVNLPSAWIDPERVKSLKGKLTLDKLPFSSALSYEDKMSEMVYCSAALPVILRVGDFSTLGEFNRCPLPSGQRAVGDTFADGGLVDTMPVRYCLPLAAAISNMSPAIDFDCVHIVLLSSAIVPPPLPANPSMLQILMQMILKIHGETNRSDQRELFLEILKNYYRPQSSGSVPSKCIFDIISIDEPADLVGSAKYKSIFVDKGATPSIAATAVEMSDFCEDYVNIVTRFTICGATIDDVPQRLTFNQAFGRPEDQSPGFVSCA
jgi:predicted acylesterase/phospholipase RssA